MKMVLSNCGRIRSIYRNYTFKTNYINIVYTVSRINLLQRNSLLQI
ncbi:Hypothetical protein EIN_225370, partial [Entamoeba invadens IP1]